MKLGFEQRLRSRLSLIKILLVYAGPLKTEGEDIGAMGRGCSGGTIVLSEVAVSIVEARVKREEVARGPVREVALLVDIQKKLKKKK